MSEDNNTNTFNNLNNENQQPTQPRQTNSGNPLLQSYIFEFDIPLHDISGNNLSSTSILSSLFGNLYPESLQNENIRSPFQEIFHRSFLNPLLSQTSTSLQNIINQTFNDIQPSIKRVISQEGIQQLETIKFTENTTPNDINYCRNNSCPILCEDFNENQEITRLPCFHGFDKDSILHWLKNESNLCPICRYEMPYIEVYDNPQQQTMDNITSPSRTQTQTQTQPQSSNTNTNVNTSPIETNTTTTHLPSIPYPNSRRTNRENTLRIPSLFQTFNYPSSRRLNPYLQSPNLQSTYLQTPYNTRINSAYNVRRTNPYTRRQNTQRQNTQRNIREQLNRINSTQSYHVSHRTPTSTATNNGISSRENNQAQEEFYNWFDRYESDTNINMNTNSNIKHTIDENGNHVFDFHYQYIFNNPYTRSIGVQTDEHIEQTQNQQTQIENNDNNENNQNNENRILEHQEVIHHIDHDNVNILDDVLDQLF